MDAFNYYYNMNGEKITWDEAVELRKDFEKNYRVAEHRYEVDGEEIFVSTVLLLIDHSFTGGTPVIFETMIFGGKHDQYQERYHTKAEALHGHARAMNRAYFDEYEEEPLI